MLLSPHFLLLACFVSHLEKGAGMIERVKVFFNDVKVEAKKVNYPSKDELIGSTWVVITTVIIASVFLGIIDLGLAKIIQLLVR